ncbi:unnamed protein product [Victoria cruziana]
MQGSDDLFSSIRSEAALFIIKDFRCCSRKMQLEAMNNHHPPSNIPCAHHSIDGCPRLCAAVEKLKKACPR